MTTTAPPTELWVLLKSNTPGAVNQAVLVSTQDCRFVTHFIKAIKKELSNKLDAIAVDNITLHTTEDSPALRPGLALSTILSQSGFINNDESPLVVKAQPIAGSPTSSHSSRTSSDEPHPKRLKRWNELNKALLDKKKAGFSNSSTPYSSTSWSVVSPIFLSARKLYIQSSTDIPDGDFEVLVTMLTWIYRCYGRSLLEEKNKNETQRLHLIAPVLWSVVQLLPDVEVCVEHTLDGNRVLVYGRFEFVLTRQVQGVAKRLCIVEAKHDDFEQGLAQNLLGCEAVADLDNSHVVYGIVTNFDKWIFVKDMDEEIAMDENNFVGFDGDGVPVRDQLMKVVGKIHALLK
ncbi:hypothetical protein BDR26DRAFT_682099 [Obelidium mucronatum]|nr:hypothetical protein BDR26DRAFT_682099 [Obelidium mucronatum]